MTYVLAYTNASVHFLTPHTKSIEFHKLPKPFLIVRISRKGLAWLLLQIRQINLLLFCNFTTDRITCHHRHYVTGRCRAPRLSCSYLFRNQLAAGPMGFRIASLFRHDAAVSQLANVTYRVTSIHLPMFAKIQKRFLKSYSLHDCEFHC